METSVIFSLCSGRALAYSETESPLLSTFDRTSGNHLWQVKFLESCYLLQTQQCNRFLIANQKQFAPMLVYTRTLNKRSPDLKIFDTMTQTTMSNETMTHDTEFNETGSDDTWLLESVNGVPSGIVIIKNTITGLCLRGDKRGAGNIPVLGEYDNSIHYWWKIVDSKQVHQNSTWMTDLGEIIGCRSLKDIVLPGTHDSCTYSITSDSPYAPDAPPWLMDSKVSGIAQGIVANWSKTQCKSVFYQLCDGIRYLDLRLARIKDSFHFVHGLGGPELNAVLEEVTSFVKEHPREVIILDFNHFYAMEMDDHRSVSNRIVDFLGKFLCPAVRGPTVTLNTMWENNESVIVIYHQDDIVAALPQFWSSNVIESPWPNTTHPTTLMKKIPQYILAKPENKFFVTQGILTPTAKTIASGFLPLKPSSLAAMANFVNDNIVNWIHEECFYHNLNIVILDFYETTNLVNAIRHLNEIKGILKN